MKFFNIIRHLLPRSNAFWATIDKNLRQFFIGLSSFPQAVRDYIDLVYLDYFPQTTRELTAWERVLGVQSNHVTPLFVACSEDGTNRIMTSADGTSWTARIATSSNAWEDICFSPELGLFCAVGSTGTDRCLTSPDGITWTSQSISGSYTWKAVTWSAKLMLFCAIANGTDQVTTSPDGVTWTLRTALEANTWNAIAWSEKLSLFVVVALVTSGDYDLMTSPDGITWTGIEIGTSGWRDIAWSSELGMFCIVGTSGSNRALTSLDGVNWTFRTPAAASTWISVTASGIYGFCAVAVAGGGINKVSTSPDGITWTSRAAAEDTSWLGVTWNNHTETLCAVAGAGTLRTMYSVDGGVTWTGVSPAEANLWSSVVAEGVIREQKRRDVLDHAWLPVVTGSKKRIQDELQFHGFDVYVHDWWTRTELLTDGDCNAATAAAYTAGNSATLSKETTDPYEGARNLRIAHNGTANPYASQTILVNARRYRVSGVARGDGVTATAIPSVVLNDLTVWTGTNSNTWQEFCVTGTATGTSFRLWSDLAAAGYVEFDDLKIFDIDTFTVIDPNDLLGVAVALNPLVNKILRTERNYVIEAGDDTAYAGENQEAGETHMEAGNYDGFSDLYKVYPIPLNPDHWRNFIYIGGETIDDALSIDENRRSEFEDLCLKICPAEKWIGFIQETVVIYFASDWSGSAGDENEAIAGLVAWANAYHTNGVDIDWNNFYAQANAIFPGDFINGASSWGFSTTALPSDPVQTSGDPSSMVIGATSRAVFHQSRAALYEGA